MMPAWAQPLRDGIRANAERLAAENGIERHVKESIDKRGGQPGLACILPGMEPCGAYKPRYGEREKKAYLIYFIDEELGLRGVRPPTWRPFRPRFYCNGHSYQPTWTVDSLSKAAQAT